MSKHIHYRTIEAEAFKDGVYTVIGGDTLGGIANFAVDKDGKSLLELTKEAINKGRGKDDVQASDYDARMALALIIGRKNDIKHDVDLGTGGKTQVTLPTAEEIALGVASMKLDTGILANRHIHYTADIKGQDITTLVSLGNSAAPQPVHVTAATPAAATATTPAVHVPAAIPITTTTVTPVHVTAATPAAATATTSAVHVPAAIPTTATTVTPVHVTAATPAAATATTPAQVTATTPTSVTTSPPISVNKGAYTVITVSNPADLYLKQDTKDGKTIDTYAGDVLVTNGPLFNGVPTKEHPGSGEYGTTVGGYIHDGVVVRPFVDPSVGGGNFADQTNGVSNNGVIGEKKNGEFFLLPYADYPKKNFPDSDVAWAFQNGPMLITNGMNRHQQGTATKAIERTAIGYNKDGALVVIHTNAQIPTNSYMVAQYMKDEGVNNAMFLDGTNVGYINMQEHRMYGNILDNSTTLHITQKASKPAQGR